MRRARQSLSHHHLATFNMGELVPVSMVEVLPGDTFRHSTSALIRCATLVAPVMHPVTVSIHHWFVPNRIIWSGWEDFITGKDDVTPLPTLSVSSNSRLIDYLGLPDNTNLDVNALPIYAYNKIFNEFYRDQEIDAEIPLETQALQNVRWAKDYFTTARAQPQAGDSVTIPIDFVGRAPVEGISVGTSVTSTGSESGMVESGRDGQTVTYNQARQLSASDWHGKLEDVQQEGNWVPDIYANLDRIQGEQGAGVDVNELRQAFAMQRFLEHRNRFGSRHVDYLRFLGIRPSDGRLDRPEYLGGGKQTIAFSEVLATAQDDSGQNPLNVADMKGHGIAAMRTRRYRRFFEESGVMMSLMSVRPKNMYQDRVHRTWLRENKDDFWQKELEAMGPQEVFTTELYGDNIDPTAVFGYNGRHDDYRRHPSYVTGEFKTISDSWHLARDFDEAPVLNSDFLKCEPVPRPWAAQENHQLLCMIAHKIQARRLVSKHARY